MAHINWEMLPGRAYGILEVDILEFIISFLQGVDRIEDSSVGLIVSLDGKDFDALAVLADAMEERDLFPRIHLWEDEDGWNIEVVFVIEYAEPAIFEKFMRLDTPGALTGPAAGYPCQIGCGFGGILTLEQYHQFQGAYLETGQIRVVLFRKNARGRGVTASRSFMMQHVYRESPYFG